MIPDNMIITKYKGRSKFGICKDLERALDKIEEGKQEVDRAYIRGYIDALKMIGELGKSILRP